MAAATLTPAATTGTNIVFTASITVFLAADKGRQIIFGASRASIVTVDSGTVVHADIIDDFPDTNPIPARRWFLRLSPQTTLDPDIKEPVGALITLTAGLAAFRAFDVGKFISIYGGLVKITTVVSTTVVTGTILSVLSVTDANPAAAPAGAWTLEVASWSAINGFPRTGEFYQGRLFQASTFAQPTTFWGSRSDDFDNYAVGTRADDAIEYTIASRKVNRIEWLADYITLFVETAGAEFQVTGTNSGDPLGGDKVPIVSRITSEGGSTVQPVILAKRLMFLDRSRKKIFAVSFNLGEDGFDTFEITGTAEHITSDRGIRQTPLAFTLRPDPRVYFIQTTGQVAVLTFFIHEKVIGFSRIVTQGRIRALATIPQPEGQPDQVWAVVVRIVNGQVKRYIEFFDEVPPEFADRQWQQLQTDCATCFVVDPPQRFFSPLDQLDGMEVDMVADGSYQGRATVSGSQIRLPSNIASQVEVGLPYTATLETMRPTIDGQVIEGMPRSWDSLFVRLFETIGGTVNNERLQYPASPLSTVDVYTGDRDVTGIDWSTDGRIKIVQDQPYPMILLALFGTLSVGEHD